MLVQLIEDPEDSEQLMLPISDEMMTKLGWKLGDLLTWTLKTNGSIILSKEEDNETN